MHPPNASQAMEIPLRTGAELLERVSSLVGRAITARQVWVMFLDRQRRQMPVLIPIGDTPPRPRADMIGGLMNMISRVLDQQAPGGSAVLALERWGPSRATRSDQVWTDALIDGAERAGVELAGLFLVTSDDIRSALGSELS
ncbi:hypothetical protein [Nakamurella panacisegetis]|nr:hypothetical protein [Nakamurella panacisegetis]